MNRETAEPSAARKSITRFRNRLVILATPLSRPFGDIPSFHMPESDLLQILLSHDRWATAQLLDACGRLSADQFHRRFEIGPGSLHDTLMHVVGAMRAWTERLAGTEPRSRLEGDGPRRMAEELRAMLEESWREFAGEARRRPLDEMVQPDDAGWADALDDPRGRSRSRGDAWDASSGAVSEHAAAAGGSAAASE
jgi:uncharacterized damage-inducible protein DinB